MPRGLLILELPSQDFRNAKACLRNWTTGLRAAAAQHLAIASRQDGTLDSPHAAPAMTSTCTPALAKPIH